MASIPLAALAVRAPEQVDTLGQYGKLVALKGMLQNQQYEQQDRPLRLQAAQQGLQQQQLATQQQKMQIDSELAAMRAYTDAKGDLQQASQLAMKYGALPKDVYSLQNMDLEHRQKISTLNHTDFENTQAQLGQAGQAAGMLLSAPPDQRPQLLNQVAPSLGIDPKNLSPDQVNFLLSDDALKFTQMRAMKANEQIDEQRKSQQFAQEHGPIPPDKLQQINTQIANFTAQYKANPSDYLLKPGATMDDYTRVDKLMEHTEKAGATQAQIATANGFRAQAAALANLAAQEKIAQLNKPTADEQRRGDLADNLNENLSALEDILKRRPELFGPLGGRLTAVRNFVGTNDEDIGALDTIKHQLGMAQISAHGMRSAQGIADASKSILNNLNNGPQAIQGSINAAKNSVSTFQQSIEAARSGARSGITPSMVPGARPQARQQAAPQQQSAPSGPPPGATHIAPGSDGRNHYTNTQGQDLGIAPN